jgi:hypothetical protein
VVRLGGIDETVLEAISLLAVPLKWHDVHNIPTALPSSFNPDLATLTVFLWLNVSFAPISVVATQSSLQL